MLQDEFADVLRASSRGDLRLTILRFTQYLEFDTFDATVFVDNPSGQPEFSWVNINNAPVAYGERNDAELGRIDPVAQHCKRKSVPIVWNQKTYTDVGKGAQWEVQARFGYRTGIALALHLPRGRHFLFGMDRSQALPTDSQKVTRMVADMQLFATLAQDAAMDFLLPQVREATYQALTGRELECLCWAMEGKTAWEIGRILNISEQTAARHLNNAAHKLGCVNKQHAIARALRLGLIR